MNSANMKIRNGKKFNFRQPPTIESEKRIEKPILSSCCCCCSLTGGMLFGSMVVIAFEMTFIVKKSKFLLSNMEDDNLSPILLSSTEHSLMITDLVISAAAVVFSMILLVGTCTFAVPDKANKLKFVGRMWMTVTAVSVVWKIFDSTYNTLPQEHFEYVISMPEFGVAEITGAIAIIISWSFTAFYLLLYIVMSIIVSSRITVLQMMTTPNDESVYERIARTNRDLNTGMAPAPARPPSTDDTFAEETIDGCSDEESEVSVSDMIVPSFIPPIRPPISFEHECDLASEIDDIYEIQRRPSLNRHTPLPAALKNFQSANGSHSPESSYYNGGDVLVRQYKPVVEQLQHVEENHKKSSYVPSCRPPKIVTIPLKQPNNETRARHLSPSSSMVSSGISVRQYQSSAPSAICLGELKFPNGHGKRYPEFNSFDAIRNII